MPRAPFQVLVFPCYRRSDGDYEFAVFRRADESFWQGIAGGGEDDETPLEAVRREAFEEAQIPPESRYLALDACASIPVTQFSYSAIWGDSVYVIPEHSFGVEVAHQGLRLSVEHTEMQWLTFAAAYDLLRFDSNRTALWELNQRIRGYGPRDGADR